MLLVVLVVGVTTAAIGTLSYARARGALEAAARARLELLARDVARNLHGELTDRAADIMTWARLETMLALTFADVDKELAELLRHAIGERRAYRALVAFDRSGEVVATAGEPEAPLRSRAMASAPTLRVAAGTLVLETPVVNPQRPTEAIGVLAAALDSARLLDAITADDVGSTPVEVTVSAVAMGTLFATPSLAGDDTGQPMLEERAAVPGLRGVDGPTLMVIVREPASVALASVLSLRQTLVRIGCIVLLLSAAAGGTMAWRLSQPIRRLTASVREITARGRPDPDADLPEATGEVGILSSAFRAMLERLTDAQREAIAQSRLALLGEVAASVAHDVRTPLSVLKTSAQLLAGGEMPMAEQRDVANMIAAEVDRLNAVVSQLVDLARTRPLRLAPQSVAALVDSAVVVLRPWARSASVVIETEVGGDVGWARADRDQVQQVLFNLLHNAVQAASPGGRVMLRARATPPWAVIEIVDSGSGFTPEALRRAFSPFFTTKPEGTGLGLTIAKRIVEEQGGEVGVRNVEGGGACVWIHLPLVTEVA